LRDGKGFHAITGKDGFATSLICSVHCAQRCRHGQKRRQNNGPNARAIDAKGIFPFVKNVILESSRTSQRAVMCLDVAVFFSFFLGDNVQMASSSKSGKMMRQTKLLTNRNQLKNNSSVSSRKRPAACIEILEDESNEHDSGGGVARNPDTFSLVETLGPMPFDVFLKMWNQVEEEDGWETADFEATHAFKQANTATDKNDTTVQKKAQYGRLSFTGTRVLLSQIVDLKYFHRFLDIGHGVGNTVLQAAYTVGCESLGIELVNLRAERADVYADKCREYDTLIHQRRDGKVSE
jgi:hypothetical protein